MQKYKSMDDFLEEVEELIKEIKNEQIQIKEKVDNYHKVNMKNFTKLREFNEICDMTNQVFEKRISNIEQKLLELSNKITKEK